MAEDGTGAEQRRSPIRIGFACHWTQPPQQSWSGTPWHLRAALQQVAEVQDLPLELAPPLRQVARVLGARRTPHGWTSTWRHGALSRVAIRRQLRTATERQHPDLVLQIQDLGVTPTPFAVLQDLSYGLLLDAYGPDGVPHFRALGRRRIDRLRRAQDRVYAQAALLLPMSEWLAAHLRSQGVPGDRVRVVNPGANAAVPVGTPVPTRRVGTARRLLFVGRDFDTKGGAQVVAAHQLLRRELGPDVTLTVAGPAQWPLRSPVPDGVTFLGRVPGAQVGRLMDTHDLFVMPSRMEGFGIAFVEALTRGLPCIGRDACAMPEIIGHDDGGRLVRSEDPGELAALVAEALADDVLYAACAAAADRRRRHFSWERAASEVVAAAEESLRVRPGEGAAAAG